MGPDETDFWKSGEEVEFDDDVEVWYAMVYKGRSEVIAVNPTEDEFSDIARRAGLPSSEWTTEPVPVKMDGDDFEYPELP